MPDFTYRGPAGLFFPSLPPEAANPKPGETYKLPRKPSDDWESPKAKKAAAKKAEPEPTPEPEPAEPAAPAEPEES
ncbi:MAG TPA: hypothetical protein VFB19_18575 [Mycobacterium sp.]|nr:hypothetical protein [Mycobacterium sp.]